MRRTARLALSTLLLLVLVAGMAGAQSRGTLTVAQGVDVVTTDPHMHNNIATRSVLEHIFDNLLTIDENYQIAPWLATEYRPLDDTTWEVRLREGVRFHNGEPFDAEAVKFSVERILNPEQRSPLRTQFTQIERVEVVDPLTVRIYTNGPSPILPASLTRLPIVPPRYIQEHGDEYFARNPVGTGPFKFVQWRRDDQFVVEANPDFWGGAPQLSRIVFRPIPEDYTRVAELLTGTVDVITNVTPQLAAAIDANPTTELATVKSARFVYVAFNLEEYPESPLQDVRVRHAINYAVDVDAIIEAVLDGNGYPMASAIHELHFGYDDSLEPYPYDPAKARQLLAEAGYPNGFRLTFMAPSGRYLQDSLVAQAIAAQLAEVGIEVDLQILEWGTYSNITNNRGKLAEMYMLGWGNVAGLDGHFVFQPLLRSGDLNSRYANPEVDRLIDLGATVVDPAERLAIYRQLSRIVHEDAPWLFLYAQRDLYGQSTRVHGWEPRANEQIFMYGVSVE